VGFNPFRSHAVLIRLFLQYPTCCCRWHRQLSRCSPGSISPRSSQCNNTC
jgi:hypothetical protein